jgi:cobaltochelatase CobS
MATKAPTIISVDRDKMLVQVLNENGHYASVHVKDMDKNTLIKLGTFLNVKWAGTPMHKTLDTIQRIVNAKLQGVPAPVQPSAPAPVQPSVAVPAVKPSALPTGSSLDAVIATMVANIMQTIPVGIDEDAVTAIAETVMTQNLDSVKSELANLSEAVRLVRPVVNEIHLPNGEVRKLDGVQHVQFPSVLKVLQKKRNIFMVGSAGTGKTTIAEKAAEALGLEFSAQSFNSQSSKSDLVGFKTANGVYVGTEFRERFQNGGIFLMDEIDNANPNILGTLNAALANGFMAFPDGMVKRHSGFIAIAAGNTYGNGATAQYVGRNPIDGATKDRFVFMDILIDENIEDAMVASTGLEVRKATKWTMVVRQCRKNVADFGLQVIVSPRATENGAHLLDAGFTFREAIDMTVLKGAKPEQAEKILTGVAL